VRWPGHAAQFAPWRGDVSAVLADGSQIAYSANYDGNLDVYVVPVDGGEPEADEPPMDDRVIGWHPDGKRVLFASSRGERPPALQSVLSGQYDRRLAEKLPVPYGEFGAFSRDGRQFVYMPQSQDFRTWKRYRGGWAPDCGCSISRRLRRAI
jgi:tricorn protease